MTWQELGAFIATIAGTLVTIAPGFRWAWVTLERRRKKMREEIDNSITATKTKLQECEDDRKNISARLHLVETIQDGDIPTWRRGQDGVILSVSQEFVRQFGAPRGYRTADLIGKRFEDLNKFSTEFTETLNDMSLEVNLRGKAIRNHVKIFEDNRGNAVYATIVKFSANSNGDVVYIAYAADEPIRDSVDIPFGDVACRVSRAN